MRKILLSISVLALSCVSLAQSNQTSQTSWAKLSGLRPGEKIQVLDSASKKHSGNFMSVSDTAISLRKASSEESIQRQDVRSVKLMENNHRLRNTLIIGAVGAGVGAGIGAAAHKGCKSQSFCLDIGGRALPAAIGAVIGGIGGAIAGVLIPTHDTIYNVSAR